MARATAQVALQAGGGDGAEGGGGVERLVADAEDGVVRVCVAHEGVGGGPREAVGEGAQGVRGAGREDDVVGVGRVAQEGAQGAARDVLARAVAVVRGREERRGRGVRQRQGRCRPVAVDRAGREKGARLRDGGGVHGDPLAGGQRGLGRPGEQL